MTRSESPGSPAVQEKDLIDEKITVQVWTNTGSWHVRHRTRGGMWSRQIRHQNHSEEECQR